MNLLTWILLLPLACTLANTIESNLEYEPQSHSPVEDDLNDQVRSDVDDQPSLMQKRLFILRGKRGYASGMQSIRPFILRGKRLFIMRGNRPVYQKRVELDNGPEWDDSQDYQEQIRWNRGFANGNWILGSGNMRFG